MKALSIIITAILTIITLGCENSTEHQHQSQTNTDSEMKISTELGILPKLMTLPYNPTIIAWGIQEKRTPARDNAGIIGALFKYSEENYQKVFADSRRYELPADSINTAPEFFHEGIPYEIKALLKTKDLSDRIQISDIGAAKPNLFIRSTISPYIEGRVAFIDKEHVLVMLYSY